MNMLEARPRRWLQFSLRTLFIAMLVVAAFFGGRESMRPAIRVERLKAERARADAMLQQAAALMERDRALIAERHSRLVLDQAQSAFDEAAASKIANDDSETSPDANANGKAP